MNNTVLIQQKTIVKFSKKDSKIPISLNYLSTFTLHDLLMMTSLNLLTLNYTLAKTMKIPTGSTFFNTELCCE